MAERTGCPVLTDLWSYVFFLQNAVFTALQKDHVTLILGTQPIRKPIHRKNLRETLRLPSQGI
jgi:hypothetical protein